MPCPSTTIRTPAPVRSTSSRPAAISSNVEGAMRPSRCSATTRTSPVTGSSPHESFVLQELRELLRLFLDGSGDHLGASLRGGRREAADPVGIRQWDRIPALPPERRRTEFLDGLASGFHDRRKGRVPWGVRAELNR